MCVPAGHGDLRSPAKREDGGLMRLRWFVLILMVLAVSPRWVCADEVPHARAYLDLLNARLAGMAKTMPAVSEAAECAAEALADLISLITGSIGVPGLTARPTFRVAG